MKKRCNSVFPFLILLQFFTRLTWSQYFYGSHYHPNIFDQFQNPRQKDFQQSFNEYERELFRTSSAEFRPYDYNNVLYRHQQHQQNSNNKNNNRNNGIQLSSMGPTANPFSFQSPNPTNIPFTSPTMNPFTSPTMNPFTSPSSNPYTSPTMNPFTSPTMNPFSVSPTTNPFTSPNYPSRNPYTSKQPPLTGNIDYDTSYYRTRRPPPANYRPSDSQNEIFSRGGNNRFTTPFQPQSPRRIESLHERYFSMFLFEPRDNSTQAENTLFGRYRTNLTEISRVCPRDSCFAGYNPDHRLAVHNLARLYGDFDDIESLMQMSHFLKNRPEIHPQVWYSSLMRAQLDRMPETLSLQRPSPIHLFPTRFFPDLVMRQTNLTDQECVYLDERIGEDNGIENRLWYFREDVQLNVHHWFWHLLNPGNTSTPIDRRGEFFYWFHHEMTARYTAERFSNGLDEATPFNMQLDSVVEEPFYPHLTDGVSTRSWAPRPPMQSLSASLNSSVFEELYNLTLNRDRFLDTLFSGSVYTGSRYKLIHTQDSINELGEIVEASNHSANSEFYGRSGYHNRGHWILANLIGNAPAGTQGVMGDETTAMRDVIFYRWHRLTDILFRTYKSTHLPPYNLYDGDYPLVFNGINVKDISVVGESGANTNMLRTFWNTQRIHVEGGLDFNGLNGTTPPNINICAKHLDHEEFTYNINVVNRNQQAARATVRLYLAPRFRSLSRKKTFTIAEQRSLFFSLDTFTTDLTPGNNVISRKSTDSTLTAPWPKDIQALRRNVQRGNAEPIHCECGYPHHLLLPKGSRKGMIFDLVVMLTDAYDDQVLDDKPLGRGSRNENMPKCIPSYIQCGLPGRKYPDSKPMGYPFDRRPYMVQIPAATRANQKQAAPGDVEAREVETLEEYISHIPNIATVPIVIAHKNMQLGLSNIYLKE